ncbi:putative E3 SUMO-protein ligase RNF212-like protein [Dinothrombium tinctorium]|uniref:Putative E3 SUMO-protein ligase RNF212-like protein n=1 Tax=Dinothrombium tinctorium TaxID=1965070 RepID=A0A443RAK2_9ACAR|nr:putative E3 SUMO-protein ligase RNF212-like protein [Dinothrombium tinctorium]
MAYFMHCNECLLIHSNGTQFHFTNCGHLFCHRCVQSGLLSDSICKVCKKRCKHSLIPGNLKQDILDLFEDDSKLMKKYEKIRSFQKSQTRNYMKKAQIEMKRLKEENTRFKTLNALMEQELTRFKRERQLCKCSKNISSGFASQQPYVLHQGSSQQFPSEKTPNANRMASGTNFSRKFLNDAYIEPIVSSQSRKSQPVLAQINPSFHPDAQVSRNSLHPTKPSIFASNDYSHKLLVKKETPMSFTPRDTPTTSQYATPLDYHKLSAISQQPASQKKLTPRVSLMPKSNLNVLNNFRNYLQCYRNNEGPSISSTYPGSNHFFY